MFKRKQRQAIVFRSFEYLGYVCDCICTVNNMRLAGMNAFMGAEAIFERLTPTPTASA